MRRACHTWRSVLFALLLGLVFISGCSFSPRSSGYVPPPKTVPGATSTPSGTMPARSGHSYVVLGQRYYLLASSRGYNQRGIASWYGPGFNGKKTASGEVYNMHEMTAAHKILPLQTHVRVTNLTDGRSVVVKINDRGPFHKDRIIDLSYAAAKRIGMLKKGTALVQVEAINLASPAPKPVVPTPAPQPDVKIYIQVAAYSKASSASKMNAQLALHGISPIIVQHVTVEGRGVYRVRIGPLSNVSRVDAVTAQLHKMGLDNTQVIIQ